MRAHAESINLEFDQPLSEQEAVSGRGGGGQEGSCGCEGAGA